MYKQFVFRKPLNMEESFFANKFCLVETLKNDRTSIWENDDVVFSVDKRVIRVFLYDGENKLLIKRIKDFFYGKEEY